MAKRTDNNQSEIVATLRAHGYSVQSIAMVGKGCPDIIVGKDGITLVVEIKDKKGKLTPLEQEWHNKWQGAKLVARTANEIIEWFERNNKNVSN